MNAYTVLHKDNQDVKDAAAAVESDQAEIEISLSTRGGEGRIFVREEEHGKNLGQIQVTSGEDWHENKAHIKMPKAVGGMYLVYEGQSPLDLLEISLHRG